MKAGDHVGRWCLIEPLGQGGNGWVWRCVSRENCEAAIKILIRGRGGERLARFRNEIGFLLDHRRHRGIVPIVDHDLKGAGRAWYVMPLALPIRRALSPDPAPAVVVEAIAEITHTLAGLAERGIFHRDLKPENLLLLDEVWSIGDFGLVKQPKAEALTRHGRKLGPIDYMERYSKPHVIEKKNNPRAASYASR